MPFKQRTITLSTRVTEREFDYVRRLAARAGKLPGGWLYDLLRQHLLAEAIRLKKEHSADEPTQS